MKPPLRFSVSLVFLCLIPTLPAQDKARIRFTDVAAASGVTLKNISGNKETKDYIVEINGNGAAFFDYDNDEDIDVLIVNGSTLANMAEGGDPMVSTVALPSSPMLIVALPGFCAFLAWWAIWRRC